MGLGTACSWDYGPTSGLPKWPYVGYYNLKRLYSLPSMGPEKRSFVDYSPLWRVHWFREFGILKRGPKDHTSIRILHSGSKAQRQGDTSSSPRQTPAGSSHLSHGQNM